MFTNSITIAPRVPRILKRVRADRGYVTIISFERLKEIKWFIKIKILESREASRCVLKWLAKRYSHAQLAASCRHKGSQYLFYPGELPLFKCCRSELDIQSGRTYFASEISLMNMGWTMYMPPLDMPARKRPMIRYSTELPKYTKIHRHWKQFRVLISSFFPVHWTYCVWNGYKEQTPFVSNAMYKGADQYVSRCST